MPSRREAVIGMSVAVLGSVAPSAFGFLEMFRPAPSGGTCPMPAGLTPAIDGVGDERLRQEMARLASREDSEEGVPVFLACINQVRNGASRQTAPAKLTHLNTSLSSEFRQTAAAWERVRPNAPVSDVAKLIEVLADRDLRSRPE